MDVWSKGCPKIQKSSFVGPDFMQVVEGVFSKCTNEEVEQFVGIARRIWMRRNETLHGGVGFVHPNTLVQQTMQAIDDFHIYGSRTAGADKASRRFSAYLGLESSGGGLV